MKISELSGPSLDAWVTRALGYKDWREIPDEMRGYWYCGGWDGGTNTWNPSADWAQGGPIIERERIELLYYGQDGINLAGNPWEAQIGCDTHYIDQGPGDAIGGSTPLIAAMRAFVRAKIGEEVPDSAD